jgi:hypothetical protein
MTRPHLRPRVVILSADGADEVRRRLRARIDAAVDVEGRVASGQVIAWITGPARRVGSPCLDLNLRPHPEGTLITGRYGPHPTRMTLYVFSGIGVAFLTGLALTWSFVQATLGEPPTCLLGVAVAAVAVSLFAVGGQVGRRLAMPQMHRLAELLDGLGEVQDDEVRRLAEAEAHRVAIRATSGS